MMASNLFLLTLCRLREVVRKKHMPCLAVDDNDPNECSLRLVRQIRNRQITILDRKRNSCDYISDAIGAHQGVGFSHRLLEVSQQKHPFITACRHLALNSLSVPILGERIEWTVS